VFDESGEDYLYPKDHFVPMRVPELVRRAMLRRRPRRNRAALAKP
jgi:hypothetical protein